MYNAETGLESTIPTTLRVVYLLSHHVKHKLQLLQLFSINTHTFLSTVTSTPLHIRSNYLRRQQNLGQAAAMLNNKP